MPIDLNISSKNYSISNQKYHFSYILILRTIPIVPIGSILLCDILMWKESKYEQLYSFPHPHLKRNIFFYIGIGGLI